MKTMTWECWLKFDDDHFFIVKMLIMDRFPQEEGWWGGGGKSRERGSFILGKVGGQEFQAEANPGCLQIFQECLRPAQKVSAFYGGGGRRREGYGGRHPLPSPAG